MKRKLGLDGRRVITCIAMMDGGRKGHATLLRAFAELAPEHADLTLLLVGDGPARPKLEQLAGMLGIESRTAFHGRAHPNEVQHVLRLSEITVLPTHCEVFGNVVFESLMVGTPVISGAAGAAKDVLPRGPFGLLFEPGDVDGLAQQMRHVLANEKESRTMAARGRELVSGEMSIARRVESFLSIYRELITRPIATGAQAHASVTVGLG